MKYANLHSHSSFSTLDGHALIDDYVATVARYGHSAAALTDHGTMAGIPSFVGACHRAGILPIVGMEAYICQDIRVRTQEQYHLTLLALNATGYANLCRLSTVAWCEGFYYKPRIDHEHLARYHDGIVVLSGCFSSEFARYALEGRAEEAVGPYLEIFGDRFFLEIQDHGDYLPDQRKVNQAAFDVAARLGLRVVATNDSHFCSAADHGAHRTLLGIATGSRLGQEALTGSPYTYVRTNEEMAACFPSETLQTSLAIAEMVTTYPLGSRVPKLPKAPSERPGETPLQTLSELAFTGLSRRNGAPATYRAQLQHELDVIAHLSNQLGADFARYFLIVADICAFARSQKIRFGPRGSAAGSVICWSLGISEPDPLHHGLVFERFLNPHRLQLPDIDIDFADDRRDEIYAYLARTYGERHVARIATYTTLGARAAIRAAARYLQNETTTSSLWLADRLIERIPDDPRPGGMPLDEVVSTLNVTDPDSQQILDYAAHVAGRISAVGTHPAGVVVADRPIDELVPLMRTRTNVVQTQYEMHHLEDLGLLKIDILGLSALSIVEKAMALLPEPIDLWQIPLNDPQAWEVIRSGHLLGLFQIGSAQLSQAVRALEPQTIDDLALAIAVYRPGPIAHLATIARRKHGEEPITSVHPLIDDLLAPTYGFPVYQEQILHIAQRFAGYSLAEADLLRKAIGKKQRQLMEDELVRFRQRAAAHPPEDVERVLEFIAPHADYSFNKAHAICYAYLAYQSAYLKAHYPAAFYAAAMTVEGTGSNQEGQSPQARVGALIREAAERGIVVHPPSVQSASADFVPISPTEIRYGFRAIKDVAEKAIHELVAACPFTDLGDLLRRCPSLDKKSLAALAQVGALPWQTRASYVDADGQPREELTLLFKHRRKPKDQLSFAQIDAIPTTLPDRDEHPLTVRLAWEQERIGMFTQPLPAFHGVPAIPIVELPDHVDERLTIAGVLIQVKPHVARTSKQQMAYARLMDETGSWNLTVFPRAWNRSREALRIGNVVMAVGKVTKERDGYDFWVDRITTLAPHDTTTTHRPEDEDHAALTSKHPGCLH